MPAQPTPDAVGSLKRSLVELSRVDCLGLLASNNFGRLAVSGGGDAPLIRPVNYMFDERSQSVVFRTASGSKLHYLLRATRATFEIDGVDAENRTGWSVIMAGATEEVMQPLEVARLERLGLHTWPAGERSHWIRIRAWSISGRRIALPE